MRFDPKYTCSHDQLCTDPDLVAPFGCSYAKTFLCEPEAETCQNMSPLNFDIPSTQENKGM